MSHENVNNTGLQGQPRSAVRSLCLIFAAGISASHEMSQSQSHVFNPLELSLLLLFRRSPDEQLTLPLFLVFIVFDTGICLMQFLLHQALILGTYCIWFPYCALTYESSSALQFLLCPYIDLHCFPKLWILNNIFLILQMMFDL